MKKIEKYIVEKLRINKDTPSIDNADDKINGILNYATSFLYLGYNTKKGVDVEIDIKKDDLIILTYTVDAKLSSSKNLGNINLWDALWNYKDKLCIRSMRKLDPGFDLNGKKRKYEFEIFLK